MESTSGHIRITLLLILTLVFSSGKKPAFASVPLTGLWQVHQNTTILLHQYYPPFQEDFSTANFPLAALNSTLDTTQFHILLIQDMDDGIVITPPREADSLYASDDMLAWQVKTPFRAEDTLFLERSSTGDAMGLPIIRLITEAEWNQLAACHPVGFRTLTSIPIFNRNANASYNLERHCFENFRRWPQIQPTDPLAVADFFKSINYTVQADGEQYSLPLDAVLTQVNYLPGTGILKIEYLLNDDNLLTLTAVVSASYPDPIFCVLAEMTYREGQTVSITANWELDRPDIAFTDGDLPPQEGLQQHYTVFAHSAESIKIARRYTEIIGEDVAAFFRREQEWWQNWHRLDAVPAGLTDQQMDQWLQALTFLEITPYPSDGKKAFDHALTRAWGLYLGGHADEANDDLGLILDQARESLSLVEWGRFLALAQLVGDRLGHFALVKSNWDEILNRFGEPVIAQFRKGFTHNLSHNDQLYLLAGLDAVANLAEKMGVPASAYVYERLGQQIRARLEQTFASTDSVMDLNLLPGLLWSPGMSGEIPQIYPSIALNYRTLWQLPILCRTQTPSRAPILPYMNAMVLARQSGFQRDAILKTAYPLLVRAAINAHLFPRTWDCEGNFQNIDLAPHIWTTCLLIFADE